MARTITLWRAAADDHIADTVSFARRRADAERYHDNPGFGGPRLYRSEVSVEDAQVCDLYGMTRMAALRALAIATGLPDVADEAETADVLVCRSPRVQDALQARGICWVRVEDTYPSGCETWTYLSCADRDDPDMTEVE